MRSFLLAVPALFAAAALASGLDRRAEDNPDDPTGKTLYITEPACGYYRCIVDWPVGSQQAVNWLGPPPGYVSVSLASNIGGPTYTIVDKIVATSQEGYCDSGYGLGVVAPGHECGRVDFTIPLGWKQMKNYTIVVQSLADESLVGYTDMITIGPANSSLTSPDAPSGTAVSLLTIADPTSTNLGASTKYTGKIPAATAITGAAARAASSSAAAGTTVLTRLSRSASAAVETSALATASSASSSAVSSAANSSAVSRAGAAASPSASTTGAAGRVEGQVAAALGAAVLAVVAFAL
ncbi:hypothetical protein JCM8097_002649 [Rhodosporidiobolus ruineniae]